MTERVDYTAVPNDELHAIKEKLLKQIEEIDRVFKSSDQARETISASVRLKNLMDSHRESFICFTRNRNNTGPVEEYFHNFADNVNIDKDDNFTITISELVCRVYHGSRPDQVTICTYNLEATLGKESFNPNTLKNYIDGGGGMSIEFFDSEGLEKRFRKYTQDNINNVLDKKISDLQSHGLNIGSLHCTKVLAL